MSDISYGFSRRLGRIDFQAALERTQKALGDEGFGVLTTIDIREALKNKQGVDFRPYTILGACNPSLAHRALKAEDHIGLLLPCNVVLQQQDDGEVLLSIADPKAMFELVDNTSLADVAEEVEQRLRRVIQAA